jgi:hypothetical protein
MHFSVGRGDNGWFRWLPWLSFDRCLGGWYLQTGWLWWVAILDRQ